ncbi:DUF4331 family protein [Paraliomyxa miuraensis]|uniref:DUF4331 family protein n=1 Tax=Paraliomyxa miuraensis TaxID=376150 RepID=UPI002256618F|nr:DUF4331 family protein [Paraliomyxa miuraensis]MCX4244508.1 DUF4331 domain-containing protein [Paraliomyxa miuraensis]
MTKAAMATVALATTGLMLARPQAQAADHIDAPGTGGDAAADITDFFAWHEGDRVVAAMAFAGLDVPGSTGTYDDQVLYGIHVDNDGDNVADQTVWARFGQDAEGNWGVKVEGLPGATADVIGPVGEVLDAGLGLRVFAGVRDDPFFFDLDGFQATLSTATLSFDPSNDTFAATNVTMIVVEMSIDGVAAGSNDLQLWATTGRL